MDTTLIRDYWDRQPCNVGHSYFPIGSHDWSVEITNRKYFVESHIPGFAQFDKWKGKRVLEIGCGIGTDTLEFVKAGAYVWAMDISSKSIDLAKRRCNARFVVADAEEGLPSIAFDLIYSFGVLHHTPNPERILKAAWNRLLWDGELRIMLYSRWCFKRLFGDQSEAQANCPLSRSYTIRQAKQLLEGCGFHVVSVNKAHIFPWRIKDYINHRYVKRWFYRFPWPERYLGEHLLIVARKS